MKENVIRLKKNIHSRKWGGVVNWEKTEKLKKISIIAESEKSVWGPVWGIIGCNRRWKSNYTDYLITEPINFVEELKRVPEADYELCTALLTMLVKEEIPENASDKTFVDHKGFLILERMNKILSVGAREVWKRGDYSLILGWNQIRFVHDVEILRCNAELYILCFKDNGVGLYFKTYHLLLTSWKTVKSI